MQSPAQSNNAPDWIPCDFCELPLKDELQKRGLFCPPHHGCACPWRAQGVVEHVKSVREKLYGTHYIRRRPSDADYDAIILAALPYLEVADERKYNKWHSCIEETTGAWGDLVPAE